MSLPYNCSACSTVGTPDRVELDQLPHRLGHPPHDLGLLVYVERSAVGPRQRIRPRFVVLQPKQRPGKVEEHRRYRHRASLPTVTPFPMLGKQRCRRPEARYSP
jgi:hypothetical protein